MTKPRRGAATARAVMRLVEEYGGQRLREHGVSVVWTVKPSMVRGSKLVAQHSGSILAEILARLTRMEKGEG